MIFKIYYIPPALLGPLAHWPRHLDRCREMGFDHLCISPPFRPAPSGNVFDVADHDTAHPIFGENDVEAVLGGIAEACRERGLTLLLDLVVDRLAPEHPLVDRNRAWFALPSDFEEDLPDPRRPATNRRHAQARFEDPAVIDEFGAWWTERIRRWTALGAGGFRCLRVENVPAFLWRSLSERSKRPFLAWTPGVPRQHLERLRGAGFDAVFSSSAWWDGKAPWFVDEYQVLSQIAPVVATVEPVFGPRHNDARANTRALAIAASTGAGFLMPIGFERALQRPLDPTEMDPGDFERDWEESPTDLTAEVAAATAQADRLGEFAGGEMRMLIDGAAPITAILRADRVDVRQAEAAAVILINSDLDRPHSPPAIEAALPTSAGASFGSVQPIPGSQDYVRPLAPGAVRVLRAKPLKPTVTGARGGTQGGSVAAHRHRENLTPRRRWPVPCQMRHRRGDRDRCRHLCRWA
jgi:starch synthase (maltosyl-transferring)